MQRANPGTGDARNRRVPDERMQDTWVTWLNSAYSSTRRLFTLGTLPRNLDDVRTPHRNNWDFVGDQGHSVGR